MHEVLAFFGVANRQAWCTTWDTPTAFRKSRVFESDLNALAAWLRIGELRAATMECTPFDRSRFRRVLGEIRSLTRLV